jgi:hypothetical protein
MGQQIMRADRVAKRKARRAARKANGRPIGKAMAKAWAWGKRVTPRPLGGALVGVGDTVKNITTKIRAKGKV